MENMEYYAQRLPCSDEEKDACLETVKKLLHLWDTIRKHGLLGVDHGVEADGEPDPFFQACLRDFADLCYTDETWIQSMRELFAQYLAAGDYHGGAFLNNVLITEGLLHLAEKHDCSFQQWADSLSLTLRGYFGAEYRERFLLAVKREIQAWGRAHPSKDSFLPEFDALADLPPALCVRLLRELPESTMAIAVKFAGGAARERLLASLTPEELDAFEDTMELCTNLRTIDVEAAQREVLEQAAKWKEDSECT